MNAALAGATLVAPFAWFKVPMAVFSEEKVSRCPWVSVAMSDVQVVRKSPRLIETSVCPDIARLVQPDPFGEENYLTVAFDSEDVASDHPLKLKYSKGRHMISRLWSRNSYPPFHIAWPGARVQAALLHATPKGCTRWHTQLIIPGMELQTARAARADVGAASLRFPHMA